MLDCNYKIGDILFIKNLMRICDVVEVVDILYSFKYQRCELKVMSLEYSEEYRVTDVDILGHVILEEGVDLYEFFKRK